MTPRFACYKADVLVVGRMRSNPLNWLLRVCLAAVSPCCKDALDLHCWSNTHRANRGFCRHGLVHVVLGHAAVSRIFKQMRKQVGWLRHHTACGHVICNFAFTLGVGSLRAIVLSCACGALCRQPQARAPHPMALDAMLDNDRYEDPDDIATRSSSFG